MEENDDKFKSVLLESILLYLENKLPTLKKNEKEKEIRVVIDLLSKLDMLNLISSANTVDLFILKNFNNKIFKENLNDPALTEELFLASKSLKRIEQIINNDLDPNLIDIIIKIRNFLNI